MLGTVVLAVSLVAGGAAGEKKKKKTREVERVLVMDVGGDALSAEERGLVREALSENISEQTRSEVLSSEDVRRVVDNLAGRQERDCDTDACLAELGAALGASRVVHATVARLGARYVVNVALIDPEAARSLGRASARADDVEGIYDAVPAVVADLYGIDVEVDDGVSGVTVFGGVVTGVGVVATGVTAGTLGYLFNETQDPRGDPELKQAFLDHGQNLGIAAAVSGAVLVVGLSVLTIGLITE